MNGYDQFRALLSKKTRPKCAKTEQNDKIHKKRSRRLNASPGGSMTGRLVLDWVVVVVVGFECFMECKFRPCRAYAPQCISTKAKPLSQSVTSADHILTHRKKSYTNALMIYDIIYIHLSLYTVKLLIFAGYLSWAELKKIN